MLFLGSDHAGFSLKESIKKYLDKEKIPYEDLGTYSEDSVDYAPIAAKLGKIVASDAENKGILCCGTGIGISIAANKVKGIRAACCSEVFSAGMTRKHNDANVLCLGGRVVSEENAAEMVKIFLTTPFCNEERHVRRIEQIEMVEKGLL